MPLEFPKRKSEAQILAEKYIPAIKEKLMGIRPRSKKETEALEAAKKEKANQRENGYQPDKLDGLTTDGYFEEVSPEDLEALKDLPL